VELYNYFWLNLAHPLILSHPFSSKIVKPKGKIIKLAVNCGPRQGQNAMEKEGDWKREGVSLVRGFGLPRMAHSCSFKWTI